jgi:hypothetical protein
MDNRGRSGSTQVVVEGGLIKGVMCNKMGPSRGKIRGKCSK